MFRFTVGALIFGALVITVYYLISTKGREPDYRKRERLKHLISQKDFEYLLIDIRSSRDYEKGHIPTAVSIPYETLLTSLPVENMFLTIIVYGDKGKTTNEATRYLSKNGYFNVTSFGAFSRWDGELTGIENKGETKIEYSEKGRVDFPV